MIPLSITFLNPKILGFLFFFFLRLRKTIITWGGKCKKLKLQKIIGNLFLLSSS